MSHGVKAAAVLLAIFLVGTARGDDYSISDGMKDKGTHGLVNIVSAPLEIPYQTVKGYKAGVKGWEDCAFSYRMGGGVVGIFRGTVHTFGRVLTGVYQLGGFWTAGHKDNDGVGFSYDDEYAWSNAPARTPLDKKDSPKRVTAKVDRGVINTAAGAVEVPKQMSWSKNKGFHPIKQTAKGLWFGVSRIVTGAYETVGFFLPSTTETEAYAFEQEKPWDKK